MIEIKRFIFVWCLMRAVRHDFLREVDLTPMFTGYVNSLSSVHLRRVDLVGLPRVGFQEALVPGEEFEEKPEACTFKSCLQLGQFDKNIANHLRL